MTKNIFFILLFALFFSCTTVKNIAYFDQMDAKETALNADSTNLRIKPKDLLAITIVSSEQEASRRYNLVAPQVEESINYLYSQPAIQSYLVDNDGNINLPILGIIHVKGMTKKELEKTIERKLAPFFIEEMPIITIRFMNFSVNIMGEVRNPGKFISTNERMTIFEGLALAGDMTIYGKRDNVKVLRENADGEKKIYTVNLNNKSIFYSPVYFLEQNDIVYVEPNQSRANSSMYGEAESFRVTTLSVIISLVTMATTIFSLTR